MAKTTKTTSNVQAAQTIVDELTVKQSELAAARANDEATMAAVAFEAHTGDQKAAAKLETLRERTLRRDLEAKNLASAIAEARRRVADAQNAEHQAEEHKVAEELLELAQIMREAGNKADKGLAMMIEGSNDLKKVVQAINARGLGSPSAQQLQSLGRRAILGSLVNSPFTKEFEYIAVHERKSFATFTAAWAAMIERAVNAKLQTKQEEVA